MQQILSMIEVLLLALTLMITLYFSYRTMKIQQQALTLKSTEEFREQLGLKQAALEQHLGKPLYSGDKIETKVLMQLYEDPQNRLKLTEYLNLYEAIARGVNLRIYDEKIFKLARKSAAIQVFHNFEEFIQQYRKKYERPAVWSEFENMVHRWEQG